MSKLTNRKLTALLLALGLLSVSSASDAGLIRMAGSTTATAPARTGSTALVSDTVQLNDLFPTVSADLLVHDGDAPDVQVVFAGSSQCDWAHEDCWGEYVPGEHVILEGAIYGGNTQTANLTFEFSIKDMTTFATVLQYTEASSETSIGTFYSDYTTPGNPCVGVHFYAVDSGACQAFSIDVEIPTSLAANTFYNTQWHAQWNAPSGMHYVFTNAEGSGAIVEDIQPHVEGRSHHLRIMRVAPVPESPALPLIVLFGLGLYGMRRNSYLQE